MPTSYRLAESRVFIEQARFHAYHGVLPQERLAGNDYMVSLSAECDLARAAETDDVADTLDYAAAYEVLRREMARPSRLVEHVAGRVIDALMDGFPMVRSVRLRIVKCNPPMGGDGLGAGVEVVAVREKTS